MSLQLFNLNGITLGTFFTLSKVGKNKLLSKDIVENIIRAKNCSNTLPTQKYRLHPLSNIEIGYGRYPPVWFVKEPAK